MDNGLNRKPLSIRIVIGVLSVAFAGSATLVAGLAALKLTSQPLIVLNEEKVVVEAGTTFDPASAILSLENVELEDLIIEPETVDLSKPGITTISYTADIFPIPNRVFEQLSLGALSPGYAHEELIIEVTDNAPPVLNVVESPVRVEAGSPVAVEDLVISVEDDSEVNLSFGSGKVVYQYNAKGEKTVNVVAVDEAGNKTTAPVDLIYYVEDDLKPVISGSSETIVEVGEVFDPRVGVEAKDHEGKSISFTVEPSAVDTSKAGLTVLTYSAVDEFGRQTDMERRVLVYDRVEGSGELRFGCFWDIAGSSDQPYLVAVNRAMNTVTVYGLDENGQYTVPMRAFTCSTGTATPTGTYHTAERMRWHSLYENEYGQYAIRITGHILFHSVPYTRADDPSSLMAEEFNKLGEAASLGCIRLCVKDEKWLYDHCPAGFITVLYDDTMSVGPLGKPSVKQIDLTDEEKRGWDPTDPDLNNPWRKS